MCSYSKLVQEILGQKGFLQLVEETKVTLRKMLHFKIIIVTSFNISETDESITYFMM